MNDDSFQLSKEWQKFRRHSSFYAHRTGWRGVWDALVSVVTGKERYQEKVKVTFSTWAKDSGDGCEVRYLQMEISPKPISPYIKGENNDAV